MNYLEIYNDQYIRNQFYEIDKSNKVYKNHGLKHALNVVSNIEKLSKILNISNEELNYLKIAGYLHDIGRSITKETRDHDIKGAEFINNYLTNKIDKNWLDKISSAVEKHHTYDNLETLSLFEYIILFADKMDFSTTRVEENETKEYFEKNIQSIDFKIDENYIYVIIQLINYKTKEDFMNWDPSNKIIKRIKEFADKLDRKYKINFIIK